MFGDELLCLLEYRRWYGNCKWKVECRQEWLFLLPLLSTMTFGWRFAATINNSWRPAYGTAHEHEQTTTLHLHLLHKSARNNLLYIRNSLPWYRTIWYQTPTIDNIGRSFLLYEREKRRRADKLGKARARGRANKVKSPPAVLFFEFSSAGIEHRAPYHSMSMLSIKNSKRPE